MTDAEPRETENSGPENAMTPPEGARADLSPAARRALEEAAARRRTIGDPDLPVELGGRDGPEPVRYGDWEKKGIAYDF